MNRFTRADLEDRHAAKLVIDKVRSWVGGIPVERGCTLCKRARVHRSRRREERAKNSNTGHRQRRRNCCFKRKKNTL